MNLLNKLVVSTIPAIPRSLVRHFASRYIAGEHLDDAIRVVRSVNQKGMKATLDVLGEDVTTMEAAHASCEESREVLQRIAAERVDSNLSIKLTSLGLKLDKKLCMSNVREILQTAKGLNNFVRIDMEDSSCTSDTIEIYEEMKKEFGNVGIVVQAYLRRTDDDVQRLIRTGSHFRLCKGIYREPEEIAFKEYHEINASYISLLRKMLAGGSFVGIATHDLPLVNAAYEIIKEMSLPRHAYEFQMLLGVRHELRDRIVRDGHTMRIYIPYGRDWYGYSIRRFKENPQIAGYVFKSLLTPSNAR